MNLTEKHIDYENTCRKMLVGKTISGVIYGEVKYTEDINGNSFKTKPNYKTKFPDIDTLDFSIYLLTEEKTVYFFWDNTFFSYGINSKEIDFTNKTNEYEQQWDVTLNDNWRAFIGCQIVDFEIFWDNVCISDLDGTNKECFIYPQTFSIRLDNGYSIIISAAEFDHSKKDILFKLQDNLLVTTNIDLAIQLDII